jgi:hypothetical protein
MALQKVLIYITALVTLLFSLAKYGHGAEDRGFWKQKGGNQVVAPDAELITRHPPGNRRSGSYNEWKIEGSFSSFKYYYMEDGNVIHNSLYKVTYGTPPAVLRPGDEFTMKLTATGNVMKNPGGGFASAQPGGNGVSVSPDIWTGANATHRKDENDYKVQVIATPGSELKVTIYLMGCPHFYEWNYAWTEESVSESQPEVDEVEAAQDAPGRGRELTEDELVLPNILLAPGTRVPDWLNDPDLWLAWIEEERDTPLDPDFRRVAHLFKEEGEALGVFWPGVLVQSVHETDFYRYGGRAKKENFNMGGVGITLDDETTTRQNFLTVRRGVRALLEHVSTYADPERMAPLIRDRNYREWGTRRFTADRTEETYEIIKGKHEVFTKHKRPAKFIDLGSGVAPGFRVYDPVLGIHMGGATLSYAGDPKYGSLWYKHWFNAAMYMRAHQESRTETGGEGY